MKTFASITGSIASQRLRRANRLAAWVQKGRGLALPHALCALCLQSTLAASLRQLLLNDSLLDIGSRHALYLELVQLLKHLGEVKHPQSSPQAAVPDVHT